MAPEPEPVSTPASEAGPAPETTREPEQTFEPETTVESETAPERVPVPESETAPEPVPVPESAPPADEDLAHPTPRIPGAYLPPSLVTRGSAAPGSDAGSPPSARPAAFGPRPSHAEPSGGAPVPAPPSTPAVSAAPATAARPGPQATEPPVASRQALALALPERLEGRLVALGSLLAAGAFFLPWAGGGSIVIGGDIGTDYFSDWGFAAPGNILPFLVAVLACVLAVVPNRIADWLRFGAIPLALAGALLAIAWTYVTWPGGYGPGVVVLLAGAFLLLVAGGVAVRNIAVRPAVE